MPRNGRIRVNGKIKFKYPQAGIFDSEYVANGKTNYTNVGIPFKNEGNGYYYYDSNEYDVKFPNNTPKSDVNLEVETNSNKGFYPFSEGNNKSFHFGMNMGINFYMTKDGKINGKDITFDFSGDDDVWVFVDGKLVLDIGGIHDAIAGKINFADGKAYVYKGTDTKLATVVRTTDLSKVLGSDWNKDENKSHTLQVFYLERGMEVSNCKIRCNLPQKDSLEVAKVLGNEGIADNEDFKNLLSKKFKFQLLVSDSEKGPYSSAKNMNYNIYKGTSSSGNNSTDGNGYFELGIGERAIFDNFNQIKQGKFYKVVEDKGNNYTTTWKATTNNIDSNLKDDDGNPIIQILSKGEQSKEINSYKFVFQNTFTASATDDVVVLDYGKKVNIDVLGNDILLGATKKIFSIDKDSATLKNGSLEISNDDDKILVYTPNKFMNSIDEAKYKVKIDNIGDDNTYVEAKVSIMPATSVYYEDDFGKEDNTESKIAIVWSKGGWASTKGNKDNRQQSSINKDYGWDDSYENDKTYSDGTAHYSTAKKSTATFTFTGTGVDVYSKTSGDVGLIRAALYKGDKVTNVVEEMKYIDNVSNSGTYYQIPTLSFDNLPYATYTVQITAGAKGQGTKGTYYLDGIRVYNPLKGNTTAEEAYKKADEGNAQYITVRSGLLDKTNTTSIPSKIEGSVFIDKITGSNEHNTTDIGTYKDYGPKNEVYLKQNQGIAFTIKNYDSTDKVYVGLKSPTGEETTVDITDGAVKANPLKVKSSSDLYYEVTPTSDGKVVIKNTTNNLLSITKVKITSKIC